MDMKKEKHFLAGYQDIQNYALKNLPDQCEINDRRLYSVFFHFLKLIKEGQNAYLSRANNYDFLNLTEDCFKNVEMASAEGSPKQLIASFDKGHVTQNPNKEYQKMIDFFKLSHDSNKKLPALSECLELFENEKYGRHIITNRDLKAGDIVAITESYIKLQHPGFLGRCHNCLKTNNLNLFPCRKNCPDGKGFCFVAHF